MLTPSKLYPLVVQYPIEDLPPQPCQKIWTLIKARKKSKCTDQPPYRVTTEDVEDVLDILGDAVERDTASTKTKNKHSMVTMCNKDNRSSLMLTPSHGKHVFALVVVTAIKDATVFAENVELLQQKEKDDLAMTMRQEMTLAVRLMEHAASGHNTPWSETTSPLVAQRWRQLCRSPTGPELEALHVQMSKKARVE